ncbi:RICIN domain-containing protein [Streptomyces sp. NPDC059761]|uniref:RICIN domain-containing protein n=1 Tax=Streptomyces sp. NPDC059761 TaxID=3346937 RepID=UPI003660A204
MQRWETFKDVSGAYQLRNTGSDKCLDGTEGGGNIVRVVLNDCGDRSSSRHAVQLWRISPEREPDAFRLQFVMTAPTLGDRVDDLAELPRHRCRLAGLLGSRVVALLVVVLGPGAERPGRAAPSGAHRGCAVRPTRPHTRSPRRHPPTSPARPPARPTGRSRSAQPR